MAGPTRVGLASEAKTERAGRVVASYGRRVLVEGSDGSRQQCVPRGKRMRIVCGDRVRWQAAGDDGDGLVTAIEPRDCVLSRPDNRGREEILAANMTQLVVVVAATPPADPFITDRYLGAARLMPCEALLVHNKCELAEDEGLERLLGELTAIGYRLVRASASERTGLDQLSHALAGHTNILVGQSGVGKSSLINALVPTLSIATREVSRYSGEGQHTTTAATLHHLPNGGEVIDSPGVRDYAPAPIAPADVAGGFAEIAELAVSCRFNDCHHLHEPDCAVLQAVLADQISARRYESYKRLRRLMERLGQRS